MIGFLAPSITHISASSFVAGTATPRAQIELAERRPRFPHANTFRIEVPLAGAWLDVPVVDARISGAPEDDVTTTLVLGGLVPVRAIHEALDDAAAQCACIHGPLVEDGRCTTHHECEEGSTCQDLVTFCNVGVALLGGEVHLTFSSIPSILPHVQNGRVRALGIGNAKRLSSLPQIPTVAEAGLPGYEAYSWAGMVAPAKTPPAVVARLNREIMAILKQPDVVDQLAENLARQRLDLGWKVRRLEHAGEQLSRRWAAFEGCATEHPSLLGFRTGASSRLGVGS